MIIRKALLAALMACATAPTLAAELVVQGEGAAPISVDIALTRESSQMAAKKNAVLAAIRKVNGATAGDDPKVMAALEEIVRQVGNESIRDISTRRDAGNNFITTLKLVIDDKEFRKLVSDAGIGVKTANSYPVLVVMDEYFTTPTDTSKPLREVVEYFSDKSTHHKEDLAATASATASASASESASERSRAYASGAASASASERAYVNSYNGSGAASGQYAANRSFSNSAASASASQSQSQSESAESASLNHSIDAGQKDVQSYRKLVEYQPQQSTPSDRSYTYEAILREAASYDLNILDNSLFRSRYFTGKPLTLQELQSSPEFARYVQAARDEMQADYFMMGSTIIYDLGKDPATGVSRCDGVVTLKAFSTAESKVLATDARSESASGNSPDQCRVNVANKLAVFTGSVVSTQIAEYWKNRNMYGQQYSVRLVSLLGQLGFQPKNNFRKVLEQVKGVKEVPVQRKSSNAEVEYSLQYSGETPIADAIGELVAANPAFAAFPNFDVSTNGTNVRICLESSCPPAR